MKKKHKGSVEGVFGCGFLVLLILALALFVGWIKNVVAFCQCDFKPSYKCEVVRGVGILLPVVGGVEGYLTIEDKKE